MAEPTYRMSMLPFGTYANPDGTESLGFAVPGMIQEPINALMRLAENSRFPDGRLGIPNPDNARNREDVLTGLLSMYGGNAMNPGRLMKGAAAKAAPEAAREAPYAMYRGAPNADGLFPTDRPLFMSSSPEVAGTYAGMVPDGPGVGSVAPAQASFVNPMVVDAQGRAWNDIPFNGNWIDSNALTYWARDAGHDGLVIKNVTDHLGAPGSVAPADTIVALKRGTVSSPLTGETLYSDTGKPSLFGSAVASAEANKPMRAYRGYGGRSEDEAFLYPERDMLFASSDPHTAATYANSAPNGDPVLSRYGISTQGAVAPLEMNFENPLRVDAQGSVWDQIPFNGKSWSTTDEIANLARERGHDGLILDNVRDGIGTAGNYLPPASTYVALKRGTVTSPLTGEMLFSDTGRPSLFGSAIAGAESNTPMRGYKGAIKPEYLVPPPEHNAFWGSSAPEVANTYAGLRPSGDIDNIVAHRIERAGGAQAMVAADFNFANPMIVDGKGSRWDRIPFEDIVATSDNLAKIARDRGHDGLVLNNILDSAFGWGDPVPSATSYAALRRGTVTSPLTGETLFSDNLPSIWGNALAPYQDEPRNALLNY